MTEELNPSDASHDLRKYARACRTGSDHVAAAIEERWGLYGYTPEIVSNVLAAVSTGLPLEAAIEEAAS